MGRRYRPQVIHRLGDLHPGCGSRRGQDVDRLVRNEQRIAGMHEACGVFAVPDEVRDVIYHRDFRVDDGVPATDRADGQLADRQFVADVHRAARHAQLLGGLRVGVERGARIAVQQRGQSLLIHVVRVLMGDHDRG